MVEWEVEMMSLNHLKSYGWSRNTVKEGDVITCTGGAAKSGAPAMLSSLVKLGELHPGQTLPLLIEPLVAGMDLADWAAHHRPFLDTRLHRHGAILFRGFDLREPEHLEAFIRAVAGESLEYRERSSPRHAVQGNIYTSTDYSEPRVVPVEADLHRAAEALNAGERVAILVGQGARNAAEELEQVADLLGAGVAKALNGRFVMPDDLVPVTHAACTKAMMARALSRPRRIRKAVGV